VKPRGIRSIERIAEETRWEREAQLQHFDALDAKAAVILGFAGILIALATGHGFLSLVGRLVAAWSGLMALFAFWPRGYPATNLRRLREKYLAAEEDFTRLHLLDTQIGMAETMAALLLSKARWLKAAMTSLAVAAAVIAVGPTVE
jgi:hypothetical protein